MFELSVVDVLESEKCYGGKQATSPSFESKAWVLCLAEVHQTLRDLDIAFGDILFRGAEISSQSWTDGEVIPDSFEVALELDRDSALSLGQAAS
jgi:hypothetical protein